ncbi:MAG TPA: hypothetical protein VHD63_18990, partial [Ktedonobacteraceae bacterium]|nr:hypothetical protein [Ktedonobacteraceae bacterium]
REKGEIIITAGDVPLVASGKTFWQALSSAISKSHHLASSAAPHALTAPLLSPSKVRIDSNVIYFMKFEEHCQ